jgi:WD40 repeat protein
VRLYDLKTGTLCSKFKGVSNPNIVQIVASFSDCGTFAICGSEDRNVFVWRINGQSRADPASAPSSPPLAASSSSLSSLPASAASAVFAQRKVAGESFHASNWEVTSAVFVPRRPREEREIPEGGLIVAADARGNITVFENPILMAE